MTELDLHISSIPLLESHKLLTTSKLRLTFRSCLLLSSILNAFGSANGVRHPVLCNVPLTKPFLNICLLFLIVYPQNPFLLFPFHQLLSPLSRCYSPLASAAPHHGSTSNIEPKHAIFILCCLPAEQMLHNFLQQKLQNDLASTCPISSV
ncbi:hypothetical protein GOP47_0026993 [Adiantum capillus-veneris]|nr:hypothetical protein GOP47_0026993 [Adiantum capillus-veneris]